MTCPKCVPVQLPNGGVPNYIETFGLANFFQEITIDLDMHDVAS